MPTYPHKKNDFVSSLNGLTSLSSPLLKQRGTLFLLGLPLFWPMKTLGAQRGINQSHQGKGYEYEIGRICV